VPRTTAYLELLKGITHPQRPMGTAHAQPSENGARVGNIGDLALATCPERPVDCTTRDEFPRHRESNSVMP